MFDSPWQTVVVGKKNYVELIIDLESVGMRVSTWVKRKIMGYPSISASDEVSANFFRVTPREFGFNRPVYYQVIWDEAKKRGLKRCSPEAALKLRWHYFEQPAGECLFVFMEGTDFCIFTLENQEGVLLIDGFPAPAAYLWDPDFVLVFS